MSGELSREVLRPLLLQGIPPPTVPEHWVCVSSEVWLDGASQRLKARVVFMGHSGGECALVWHGSWDPDDHQAAIDAAVRSRLKVLADSIGRAP